MLAERIVDNHNARLEGCSVREILEWAVKDVCDEPSQLFTKHSQPQSRMRNQSRGMSKDAFLDPDNLRTSLRFSLCPKKVVLKNSANQWRSKREIMLDLKSRRGNGPFMAKNMWRILVGFNGKPVPTDMSYCETGPGARRFLNI